MNRYTRMCASTEIHTYTHILKPWFKPWAAKANNKAGNARKQADTKTGRVACDPVLGKCSKKAGRKFKKACRHEDKPGRMRPAAGLVQQKNNQEMQESRQT